MAEFLLTDDDLSELEEVVTSSSPDTMVISRLPSAPIKTSQGTFTKNDGDFVAVITVLGRLQPVTRKTTEQMKIIANKFAGRSLYQLQMPFDTDIRQNDRVTCRGRIFDVVSSQDNGAFTIRQHPIGVEII